MKTCTICKQEKELSEFSKNKVTKDGLYCSCKDCNKIRNENKKSKIRQYYQDNKEKSSLQHKEHYQKNKEKSKIYHKSYVITNKDKIILNIQNYQLKNKDKILEYVRIWKELKGEKKYHKEYSKNWSKNKRDTDLNFKIKDNLRCRLYHALKNQKSIKYISTLRLLGCNIEFLKQHLESQFLPEMSWSNHGIIWEVDHIIPCSKFDLSKLEEQQRCFHYTNLQPLFKTNFISESFGYNLIGNRNKSNN